MLNISKELFSAWNDASILYCHWKSNEHLNPGLDGFTDLDVLLANKDKEKGETILYSLDFIQCQSPWGGLYTDVDDWLGFDQVTGRMIHIHLHYCLITGHLGMKEYYLPWTDLALKTRIFDKVYNVFIMEPNLELLTLYTRIGLKVSFRIINKIITRSYNFSNDTQKEIDYLKNRINEEKLEKLFSCYYGLDSSRMLQFVRKEKLELEDVLKIRRICERVFKNCKKTKYVRLKEICFFIILKIRKKVRNSLVVITRKTPKAGKGITICILGQDGAGKTTVTNDLIKWLSWKLDVRSIYLGSGANYNSWVKKAIDIVPHFYIFKPIRFVLYFIKYFKLSYDLNTYIKNAEKYSSKGGIVLFDRFPQVEFKGINDGPKLETYFGKYIHSRIVYRIITPFIQKEEANLKKASIHTPDIVFKLILPPEESIRRKPEDNLEMVRKKHFIIKSLKFPGSKIYTIDATMPYNKEILTIKQLIWKNIPR